MKTTNVQNALIRKNGEFIVKDQIIFQYPEAVTTRQVKAQVNYLLGRRAAKVAVEVKQLDKNKHLFLIAAPGTHLWNMENVGRGLAKPRPMPPPRPPIIPSDIIKNSLSIYQNKTKNMVFFKSNTLIGK